MDAFTELGLMLGIATAVACLMYRLKQPLILGHILTGILVGPVFLNIFHSQELFDVLARLGITVLLFIVGIGLSPKVTREVGKASLLVGIGQIVLTFVLGGILGFVLHLDILSSVFIAIAFTFSSTIVVSKLLSDKHDLGSLYGRLAVGTLLVQDVAATFLLIAMSAWLQGSGWNGFLFLLPTASILFFVLWIISRFILPKLSHVFAGSQEFLLLFSITWGCGLAALFHYVGLSMEIGALAAGLSLASSPYQYEIAAKMKLLRDFFIVLFFILLGAQMGFGHVWEVLPIVFAFSCFVLIAKPLIIISLLGLLGYGKKTSFMTGLTVAQVSEFSLLIVLLGVQAQKLSQDVLTITAMVALITIAGSTLMLLSAEQLYSFCAPVLRFFERRSVIKEHKDAQHFDAILFGCHRVGTDFLPSLIERKDKFLVVDFDPEVIRSLEARHIPARYGDAEDNEFLNELDLKHAKLIISTLPDIEANIFILEKAKRKNRLAIVIVVAQTVDEAEELYTRGASYVVMPHYLGGNHAALLLHRFGTSASKFKVERTKHASYLAHRREHST